MLSQGLSSTTNFGLTAILAVTVAPAVLGRVVSVVSVYLLALTLCRSLVTERLVAGAGDTAATVTGWPGAKRRILLIAAGATLASLLAGLVVRADGATLAILVAPIPVLLVQDGQRYLAWATGRPGRAVALDGCWLLVSGTAAAACAVRGVEPVAAVIAGAWALGGTASWLLGLVLIEPGARRQPVSTSGRRTAGSFQGGSSTGASGRYSRLAYSQALSALSVNLGPIVVALALSPTMAAVAKSLLLPFTPLLSLFAGLRLVTLPALRRAVDGGRGRQLQASLLGAGVAAALVGSALVVLGLRLVPASHLGDSLGIVLPHLPLGAALCVIYVAAQQLADGMALGHGRDRVVGRRLVAIALEWGGLLTGAVVAGVPGLALGWVIGLGLAAGAWLPTPRRAGTLGGPVQPLAPSVSDPGGPPP